MQKYGIVGGMNSSCSYPPELLVPIAKSSFPASKSLRTHAHYFFNVRFCLVRTNILDLCSRLLPFDHGLSQYNEISGGWEDRHLRALSSLRDIPPMARQGEHMSVCRLSCCFR